MSLSAEIKNFILHLRIHYMFFILSGGYLMAALFVQDINWVQFGFQFLNVHVLLFGGATAYNSFWDKDEGPIGGLKSPPPMTDWMWTASLVIQFIGLAWAFFIGLKYSVIYASSMLLFWLYSTPLARWKGDPLLSLVAIGVSTGTNSFLLGLLAAGQSELGFANGAVALGVAFILLSLYPASQIFQIEEDERRGDTTFAMKFGLRNVRIFFVVMYISGVLLISGFMYPQDQWLAIVFFMLSSFAFVGISWMLFRLTGRVEEYFKVMKIKFFASFSFVLFILSALLIKSII